MSDSDAIQNDFITKVNELIEENISNTQFGVSELAQEIGMSRSNLLRKVKSLTKLSVSQYIRQIRLKHSMQMLHEGSLTVSEVSYRVGFSSTSYFIKCFHDFYGFSPGEAEKRNFEESNHDQAPNMKISKKIFLLAGAFIILVLVFFIFIMPYLSAKKQIIKSIAVLPFRNDSNDSSNLYIINGLMESILTNLQKIEDLNVISRTSVEKYRNTNKSISDIAKELNAYYIVEGSGQKVGNKVLLNIQLIDAKYDKHLWAQQYNKGTEDIFTLQLDVAKNIAEEIKVILTPEEVKKINKIPTDNPVAYDFYLKGLEPLHQGTETGLIEAIPYFEKATVEDPEFSDAYANLAIAYYYLDIFQIEKKNSELINNYADKALLFDSHNSRSLIAKAFYYMNIAEYDQALPYFEKALDYSPNSAFIINFLSDFYTTYRPNTGKYLEYALKGIQLDIASSDSATASFTYLHVSNALIQSGFVDEALRYINKSLEYNPQNIYSEYVKAYIFFSKNKVQNQIIQLLLNTLEKDPTRLDVLQEVAKIYYYLRDFDNSYIYYKRFLDTKNALNMDIYPSENSNIAVVFSELGFKEESSKYLNEFKIFADNNESIYKNYILSNYYSYIGDTEKALEYLRLFSNEEDYFYWVFTFAKIDPLYDNLKDSEEFKMIIQSIETKFWNKHKEVKAALKAKKLI